MEKITGIAASNGIAMAQVFKLEQVDLTVEKEVREDADVELQKLDDALSQSVKDLEQIRERAKVTLGEEEAEVFSAHILVLSDPEFITQVRDKIKNERINAEFAMSEVSSMFVTIFETMDDEYMRERAADIKDVTKRVLAYLLGKKLASPAEIRDEVIIVAEDLTPSETAQLDRNYVKAFATNIGGRTSHSAIMARSLEVPAVVGTNSILEVVNEGDYLIVDGLEGCVIINPSDEVIAEYAEKAAAYAKQKEEWAQLKDAPSVTKDGVHFELVANIGSPDDLESVLANGGEGVGLYRTEFLYMGKTQLPTEEEQFEAYKKVLETMDGKPVVVRTLDIGGDKELPYFEMPVEMNPFLGYRALRLCLGHPELFKPQLRALLRASIYGNLKIMFPMVATLEDFRNGKAMLEECKQELLSEGVEVSEHIEVGMMVEIPSAAVNADLFAKEVDFFSIGTNDLVQYTFAADRMNENVSYLYQPYNPAILRLVKMVIDASHKEGKWTGMCGEMAGDEIALPLLIALGLDEFSMSATSILQARHNMKSLSKAELETHVDTLLNFSTTEEVVAYVKSNFMK